MKKSVFIDPIDDSKVQILPELLKVKLILSIGTIRTLLETTVESSKRAASVIQNIKSSLSVTKGQKKEKIDLRQLMTYHDAPLTKPNKMIKNIPKFL